MGDFILEGSAKTPVVELKSSGDLLLKGRSIPENSIEFYKPIIDWIDSYSQSVSEKTVLSVQLEYFNTSSSKCILDVFKKLESLIAITKRFCSPYTFRKSSYSTLV